MGKTQSTTASWSVDDWAYGTGQNVVTIDEVMEETSKLPAKYFGGAAIEKDKSMHQMQHDLLSFDDTLKRIFRRKKNKQAKKEETPQEEYYYEYEEEQPKDSTPDAEYLEPIFGNENESSPTTDNSTESFNKKLFWRCTYCTSENKVTESACRRCGQAETKF